MSNIFFGAQIKINVTDNDNPVFIDGYYNSEMLCDFRLPTVHEARRNEWLAPWPEMPPELKKLRCLYRMRGGNIIDSGVFGENITLRCSGIEAVMILGQFMYKMP